MKKLNQKYIKIKRKYFKYTLFDKIAYITFIYLILLAIIILIKDINNINNIFYHLSYLIFDTSGILFIELREIDRK